MNILYRINKLRVVFIAALSVMTANVWAHHHDHTTMQSPHHEHAMGDPSDAASTPELTLSAKLLPQGDIEAGKPITFSLVLAHEDGSPVVPNDLVEVHTERVHLLIIDPSVSDYHHEHPKPTEKAGEYVFSMTPKKSGEYLVFVDVRPEKTQRTEYLPVTLEVAGKASSFKLSQELNAGDIQKQNNGTGLQFNVSGIEEDIVANQNYGLTITVSDEEGNPFNELEAVMGAFAHMVGFNEDRSEMVHIHPLGKKPTSVEDLGGPDLDFHIAFKYPGFYRMFLQVQVNAEQVFVPFDVYVKA